VSRPKGLVISADPERQDKEALTIAKEIITRGLLEEEKRR